MAVQNILLPSDYSLIHSSVGPTIHEMDETFSSVPIGPSKVEEEREFSYDAYISASLFVIGILCLIHIEGQGKTPAGCYALLGCAVYFALHVLIKNLDLPVLEDKED